MSLFYETQDGESILAARLDEQGLATLNTPSGFRQIDKDWNKIVGGVSTLTLDEAIFINDLDPAIGEWFTIRRID